MRRAAKVAFIRPGDVYLFSGGIAHAVLCVSEEMCLGAYESIVTMNPVHVEHFLHTDDTEGVYFLKGFSMDSAEFNDTKEDCIDQLEDAAEQLENGGPDKADVSNAGLSATWDHIRAQLNADQALQATLRAFYAKAVHLCSLDTNYFAEKLPEEVLQAAEACAPSKRHRSENWSTAPPSAEAGNVQRAALCSISEASASDPPVLCN